MGLDLETTGLYPWLGANIDLIALHNDFGISYVLEAEKYPISEIKGLLDLIKHSLVIGHNIKFDCNFLLHHYGVSLENVFCTQIASQIVDNGRQKELKFSLVDVCKRFIPASYVISKQDKKKLQESFVDPRIRAVLDRFRALREKQMLYAAEDVKWIIPLYDILSEKILDNGLQKIARLEFTLLPVLSRMEVRGAKIDKEGWKALVRHWEKEILEIEDALDRESVRLLGARNSVFEFQRRRTASVQGSLFSSATPTMVVNGRCVNYSAQPQVVELWREFGEDPPLDEQGTVSIGEESLQTYLTEHPESRLEKFIDLLLEYREVDKLISTYGYQFLEQLDENSRIHTSYTQTRTETGRLSSKEPNLQNIPSSEKEFRNVRRFFVARPGYKIITCDMNSAEVAIAADYSGEELLIDSLLKGVDMHSMLASLSFSIIFNKEITIKNTDDEITIGHYTYKLSELRKKHKNVLFAKFYKGGAKRIYKVLSKYINRHCQPDQRLEVAKRISSALDQRLPALSHYLSSLIAKAQVSGYLTSDTLGRIRYLPKTAFGEAANYPIQGTNANALKIALIRLDREFANYGLGVASILMNIHDEVVCEVREDVAEELAQKVQAIMGDSLSYFLSIVKGGATAKIGDHWQK